jgi:hypothetical protein
VPARVLVTVGEQAAWRVRMRVPGNDLGS